MILLKKDSRSSRVPKRRSLKALFTTLLTDIGSNSQYIKRDCLGTFSMEGQRYWQPRFVFRGDRSEEPPLKIGIFAGIHGDEVAGILACFDLLRFFEREPFLARAYHLHFYPLVNPTGFEDGTRHARSGCDLNREFWRDSSQPEVRLIEEEIRHQNFDGIISLHSDDTSEGLYGFVRGATLTEHLLKPALMAAEAALPVNEGPLIDGFHAINGINRS
jgi:protein MpaA